MSLATPQQFAAMPPQKADAYLVAYTRYIRDLHRLVMHYIEFLDFGEGELSAETQDHIAPHFRDRFLTLYNAEPNVEDYQ